MIRQSQIQLIILVTMLLLAMSGSSYWLYAQMGKKAGHLLNENCESCHLGSADELTKENAYLLIDRQETICIRCHENSVANSHPSGIQVARDLTEPFKTDWKHELTCSSCHNIHQAVGDMNVSDLRGKAYCLSCHDDEFFSRMKDGGASLIGFGHMAVSKEYSSSLLDEVSIQCITCHDKLEGVLKVSLSAGNIVNHSASGSHPVGADYQEATLYGGYIPKPRLNPAIKLPNGKVACISCHEGYTSQHGGLVISMDNSGLCQACHDL